MAQEISRVRRAVARTRLLAVLLALLLIAVPAVGLAASPLQVIPDDALGVAVLNSLSDTSARVHKLTEKMQLPVPELLQLAQLYTGIQEGVDLDGTIAAAMFPADESASWMDRIAYFVPVTDYNAFVAQLQADDPDAEICEITLMGQSFLASEKDEFAVIGSADSKALLEKIQRSEKNVATLLAPMQSWLDNQQLAIALTPTGKELVVTAAAGFFGTAMEAAQQAGAQGDDSEEAKRAAEAVESASEMMRILGDVLSVANQQISQVGIGIRIDDTTAFHLSTRMLFKESGGLSSWAAEVDPPKSGLLAGLPKGDFTLAYGGAAVQFNKAFAELFNRLTQTGMMALGLGGADQQKFAEVMAKHRENQVATATVMGRMRPGDSLYSTMIQIEHVKDAQLQMKLSRELYEVFAAAKVPGADSAEPVYALRDVTVDDLKTIEITMDMGAMIAAGTKQSEANEAARGFLDSFMGNEGVIKAYATVADDHTLVLAYSKEQIRRAVDHIRSGKPGLETDESVGRTDKLLPEGAQWAFYLNPQGIVDMIGRIMKQMPLDLDFEIPPFPESDPIGAAAKVSAEGLDAELVLPESVVAGIGQYIGVVQQMMMQGGAPLP